MRSIGTIARGIRTPIIKSNDNLEDIIIDSLFKASKEEGFEFKDKDVIGITEGVVGITENNFVTIDDIASDLNNKIQSKHIGYLFPSPMSRNRFIPYLRGIARAVDKITLQIAYPQDPLGNRLFDDELLYKYNINPYSDVLDEETYNKYFGGCVHLFTGVDYIKLFREVVENESCEIEFVFANDPRVILDYVKDVIVGNVHERYENINILKNSGANIVLGLHDLMNESINGSGCNPKYGLLGSNISTDEKLKLFPAKGQILVENIQNKLKELTGKTIEVLVYGDGAFKDPVCGIWELADPVVCPAYTKGLEGTPNELKIKYISDNDFSDLKGDALSEAVKKEIQNNEVGNLNRKSVLGTTPRRYTDLLGSLCDLMSGSGDKGTPVVYIQGYFDNYAD